MAVYYIDSLLGCDGNDGLSEKAPKRSPDAVEQKRGDTLLFCRGSFFRQKLPTEEGVAYGAYGDGPRPTFCVSTDISDPSFWVETEEKNIWLCTRPIHGEVGNLIFGDGDCGATLRFTREELSASGDFFDSRYGKRSAPEVQELLLYSEGNPAEIYSHIEAASYADRHCADIKSDTVFSGLRFINSGVHALAGHGDHVVVRDCSFENIGGCVWSLELRVRFGNAIEIWHHGNDILVCDCSFKSIYDSCVTHQGPGEETEPTKRFICRNNVFDTYGMAAFEYRDKLPVDSEFCGNVCRNAGCGFAMLGETLPRRSEIYPLPMGHHIFMWRIDAPSDGGSLLISDNEFGDAPNGGAVFSIISESAETQVHFRDNSYTAERFYSRFDGRDYTDAREFKSFTEEKKRL